MCTIYFLPGQKQDSRFRRYLDASTRDQYASGDLDARVEDVLGQIRELSIAGTV